MEDVLEVYQLPYDPDFPGLRPALFGVSPKTLLICENTCFALVSLISCDNLLVNDIKFFVNYALLNKKCILSPD